MDDSVLLSVSIVTYKGCHILMYKTHGATKWSRLCLDCFDCTW
jgi:hypothetical protein